MRAYSVYTTLYNLYVTLKHTRIISVQSTGAGEYTDYISTDG